MFCSSILPKYFDRSVTATIYKYGRDRHDFILCMTYFKMNFADWNHILEKILPYSCGLMSMFMIKRKFIKTTCGW